MAKLTLVLATLCFIVYKLFFAYNIQDILSSFSFTWNNSKLVIGILTLLLLSVNLTLEALKWKISIQKHEAITLGRALKCVLAGISLGILTPNHVGDFAGKTFFLTTYSKVKGAVVSMIGSIAQTLSILFMGSIGLWLVLFFRDYFSLTVFYLGLTVILLLCIAILYLFLNIQRINPFVKNYKIQPYIEALTGYSQKELSILLLLSVLRFGVFNTQYYLLLHFFEVAVPIAYAFPALAAIFLVQSFVPSFILIEVGVRGATALFFLGLFSTNTSGILLAAYSLWMINLMLPGLMGLYYIVKLKWRIPS